MVARKMQQQQYYPIQRKIEIHNGTKYIIDIKRPVLSEEECEYRMKNLKREAANLMICYLKQKGKME